ncbi:MAG TPA: chemotaxis protein CheX [Terriglobia bacterium]|nr:chemotaxis protein CheX [Terriglobia bacterium]
MNEWLQRMEAAANDVFASMLGVQIGQADFDSVSGSVDLTALVSLTGTPEGLLEISCHTASAARLAMLMLGSDGPESDDYAKDALGEICNMVAGGIKSRSSSSEDRCRLSVPAVISGKDYTVRTLKATDRHKLCLAFEGRPLQITLELYRGSQLEAGI